MHETLLENQSMDVRKSEFNIVHKTLWQNNSSDVPTNVITELKYDEHKEPSVIEKGTSHFNIFECSRNLLDQLDVTYQQAFMASPVQEGFYQPSPAQERYYDKLSESLIKAKVGSDVTINNDNLKEAITHLKSEKEAKHERNILDMTQVHDYRSPWKDKDATTVNDTASTFLDSYDDEISDSDKMVEASKEPIKDTHVHNTLVGTNSFDSVVTGVVIIGRGGPRAISGESITQLFGSNPKQVFISL